MLKTLKTFYCFLDTVRRFILNVLFIVTVIVLMFFILARSQTDTIPNGTLLRLDLTGALVEVGTDSNRSLIRTLVSSNVEGETRLSDVLEALQRASEDPRVSGVVLELGELSEAGMASIREITTAIDRYRQISGKKVWVWAPSYTQTQYLIGLHADHLAVHPMGMVEIKGLSSTSLYLGEFFKLLGIQPEVRKAGTFKSAPEMLVAEEPSAASLLAQKSYMDEAWNGLISDVERRRGLPEGSVVSYLNDFSKFLDMPKSVLEILRDQGYIDAISSKESFEASLIQSYSLTGQRKDLSIIDYREYLNFYPSSELTTPGIGVIVVEGEISQISETGGMTPERFSSLLSAVEMDPNVKVLLLRVNSPGGDALASEMIRTNLETFKKETGIPVIVSMGDTAASGGYWIATAGDKIIADPYSITGSIGVFAMTFHAEELKNRLNIGRGGYRTSPLADIGKSMVGPLEIESRWIDHEVNRTYVLFKHLVEVSRKMPAESVEAVAQGRIWMGTQAFKNGLVDELGGYDEAIKLARKTAGLPLEAPCIRFHSEYEDIGAFLRTLLQVASGEDLVKWFKIKNEWETMAGVSGKPMARLLDKPTL